MIAASKACARLGSLALVALLVGATASPAFADEIRAHEWMLRALDVAKAQAVTTGRGVVVGLIDTGVDATNPDLVGNIRKQADFTDQTSGTGSRTSHGDSNGHGTAMAGLIVGHGRGLGRKDGILGIAPQARLVVAQDGAGDTADATDMAEGIRWAVRQGATVICIAEAGFSGNADEERAIDEAEAKDVVVVAGVGNRPRARYVEYPAAYPGVLAAAGTDQDGKHASISVTGGGVVLSAPATDIYSDGLHHAYSTGTGTSPSTAIIAGAAALVRARFPKLSAVEVIHRLTATAIDKGAPGRDDEYGYGELNLVAALTAKVPPLSAGPSPSAASTEPALVTAAASATPTPQAADSRHGTPWLALGGLVLVALAVIGAWVTLRKFSDRRSQ